MERSLPFRPALKTVGHGATARYEQLDHILVSIKNEINTFRRSSFRNFGLEVLVVPADKAHFAYDGAGNWIGYDEYKFDATDLGPKNMRVTIATTGEVKIALDGRWASVLDYMENLEPSLDVNEPVKGGTSEDTLMKRVRHQSRWWAMNGKFFPLVKLAPEIREKIYGYAIGDRVEPYPTHKARELRNNRSAIATIRARQPNINLMFASKLLYREMSYTLFKHTAFYVTKFSVLRTLLRNSEQQSRIRKLVLALPTIQYFDLFGETGIDPDIDIWNENEDRENAPRDVARNLRAMDLDELIICFEPPPTINLTDPIPKILKKAWPFIRAHPVNLVGVLCREASEFHENMGIQKLEVEQWQKDRLAVGLQKGTIQQFYEERDEEEGGVRVYVASESRCY